MVVAGISTLVMFVVIGVMIVIDLEESKTENIDTTQSSACRTKVV